MILDNNNLKDKDLMLDEEYIEIEEECQHMKMIYVNPKLALLSDRGLRKKVNQDNGMVGIRKDGASILVVTDGVSSCLNSQKASEIASEKVYDYLFNSTQFSTNVIEKAIYDANNYLFSIDDANDTYQTTIVVAIIKNGIAMVGWIGDSRAYLVGDKESFLLTEDDSWINMAKKKGYINNEEAINHPKRHIITQSLGSKPSKLLNIHTSMFKIGMDNGILLCTDGLWDYVEEIESINPQQPIKLTLMKYINNANRNGGKDNITLGLWLP